MDINLIKNWINESGKLSDDTSGIELSISEAEKLCRFLIGKTFSDGKISFTIRMLEIYYGGIGDHTSDWYRSYYINKKSSRRELTSVQQNEGYCIYLSTFSATSRYARFDIVVGNKGVPISFLVRSIWTDTGELIGPGNGAPNKVLRHLGLTGQDHGKKLDLTGTGINNPVIVVKERFGINPKNPDANRLWRFYTDSEVDT